MTLTSTVACAQTEEEHRLIAIARAAIIREVRGETAQALSGGALARPVFVTIEIDGKVRGCRGDLIPRTRALESEVALAARSAAVHDPRYRPLSPADLSRFLVTVTVVDRTEPLANVNALSPEDGLVLTAGGQTGVVLPWEGKEPSVRLDWAYRKAGVGQGEAVSLRRLVARRFRG